MVTPNETFDIDDGEIHEKKRINTRKMISKQAIDLKLHIADFLVYFFVLDGVVKC